MDNQKPLRSSVLDRNHRHAKGLQACCLFNDKATKVWDFTRNGNVLDVVNASWVADGMQFDANGEYAELDNINQVVNNDEGAIILHVKSLSSIGDGILRSIFGSVGAVPAAGRFGLWKNGSSRLDFLLRDASVALHRIQVNGSKVPNWETGTQIALLWRRSDPFWNGDSMVINVDGNHVTPDVVTSEVNWSSTTVNTPLAVGNDMGATTRYANCIFSYVYIYNRILNETILKNIYKKPYAMFIR